MYMYKYYYFILIYLLIIELWNGDSYFFYIRKVLWLFCMLVNLFCLVKDLVIFEIVYSVFLIKSLNIVYIYLYNMMLKFDLVVILK